MADLAHQPHIGRITTMSDSETKDLGNELARRTRSNSTGNDIVFDPNTGELVLVRPGDKRNPDSTTVNQIAEDGFARTNDCPGIFA
jgi:hypothetical protein